MSTTTPLKPEDVLKNARVNLAGTMGTLPEDYLPQLEKAKVNIEGPIEGTRPADLAVDPAPFDVDGSLNEWLSSQPIEVVADRRDAFHGVLAFVTRPFVAQGYNTLASYNRGLSTLATHIHLASDFLERNGIGPKEQLFDKMAQTYEENANYYRHRAEANGLGFIDELVSDAVGSAVPSVAQFMLDLRTGLTLPYMAGSEAAYQRGDNPLAGGLIEAAKTGTLGAIFKMIAPLNVYLRTPLAGTVGGFQAMEGAPEDQKAQSFAKGFVTMGAFAALSPGGRLGLNEVVENAKPLIEMGANKVGESFMTWADFVDRSRMDPKSDIRELLWNEEGSLTIPSRAELAGTAQSIYQNVVNRFAAIENLTKRAEELGVTFQPGEDPQLRTRGYLGIGGKVQSVLRDKTFRIKPNGKIEITGEGLKPILDDYQRLSPEKDVAVKTQEFNDFFTAVRTIEDLQRPKGDWTTEEIVTPEQVAEAEAKLDALRTKYGATLPQFNAVADRLYSFQRRVLYSLVDSGNLSVDQVTAIVTQNPHYVPFQRILDEVTPEAGGGPKVKKPFTEAKSPVKRIKGSELEIADVAGSIIRNTYQIMDVAERNTVARIVGRMASDPRLAPLGIERVPIPVHAIHVSPDEINTITRTLRSRAQQVREEIKQSTTTTAGGTAPAATTAPMRKLEGIVLDSLKARGFTEGEAASALEQIKKAAAGKPQEAQPGQPTQTVTQTIEKTINKMVKETEQLITLPTESTIWRPSPYKPKGRIIEYYDNGKKAYIDVPDLLYEAMRGFDENSIGFFTKIFSTPSALLRFGVTQTPDFILRNFIRDNTDAFIQSTTGFRPFVDSVAAIADVAGRSDLYYDWLRSGAAHSTFVDLSQTNLTKIAAELQKDPSAWRYLNLIGDLGRISQGVEEATRLGIYKAAIRNGKSDVEAMFAAREGTVDFGVRGQSKELRQWSSATAFFNPGIQGLARFLRAEKDDPIGTSLKAIGAITVPSVVLWAINKDDPDYKEIPQWRRDLFWNIKVGGQNSFVRWVSIPKPFTIGMVYGSTVERFLDYAQSKDPKALKGLVTALIDSATPMSGDPASVLIPTFAKPIIENTVNWNFFRQRPVVPVARENMLPESQYGKYTGEAAKIIGQKLGWSPAKIENYITGLTGGGGQYSLDALDLAIEALTGKKEPKRPTEAADIPVLKAFVGRPVESDPQSLRDFYDDAKEIEAGYLSFRDAMKNIKPEDANRFLREHPKLLLSPTVTSIKENVATINKMIELAAGMDIKDEKKRETIRQLERVRLQIAQAANKLMGGTAEELKGLFPEEKPKEVSPEVLEDLKRVERQKAAID